MLITVQFPFADTRRFARDTVRPFSVPGWPAPEYDEFVRCYGIIDDRTGFHEWIPEPRVCNARRAIRFPNRVFLPVFGRNGSVSTSEFMILSRRLFFDGRAMGKLELSFAPRGTAQPNMQGIKPEALVDAIGNIPITVPIPAAGPPQLKHGKLSMMARLLPQQWVAATSSQKQLGQINREKWWVASGTPTVIISTHKDQQLGRPRNVSGQAIQSEIDGIMQSATVVFASTRHIGGFGTYWNLVTESASRQLERRTRITLLRLHAESTALRQILKFINSQHFNIEPHSAEANLLELYLQKASLKVLKLTAKVADLPDGTLSDIHRVYAESTPGERDVVLERLRNQLSIRPNYFRTLQRAIGDTSVRQGQGGERSYVVSNQDVTGTEWQPISTHIVPGRPPWNHVLARDFHDCLINGFDEGSLTMMLRYQLDKRLDVLVKDGSLDQIVAQLIAIAEREGWIYDLVDAAHRVNDTNKQLAAFVNRVSAKSA